jgi:hypothetical protein
MVLRDSMSLQEMLHKDMHNEVPQSALTTCAESDQVLVENLLRLAQAELCVLNLASTTIVMEGKKIVVRCALTGPTPSVSLSNMRALQNYSPARVAEVRVVMHDGSANLVLDVCDCTAKMTATELEIVRITKRHRTL